MTACHSHIFILPLSAVLFPSFAGEFSLLRSEQTPSPRAPDHTQSCRNMEANPAHEDQEEYVLLDLDDVSGIVDIPPNAKYVLTGLDTLNPVLIIDDKLKLIGEYEETIGTGIVFTEEDVPVVHEETGPSEANLFSGTRIIDSNQPPTKQVKPLCQLHKVLKFRISPDSEIQGLTAEETK